ncbi:MAG: RdgB/HAM1 family non-canonical purine NTP pyrophosphatase [Deltaproteobacteria bacterium]|nr:RdgB/HAM1 family non-canonical purine NTP pyrophosphatase [Deltaproteobacteria bacterium]
MKRLIVATKNKGKIVELRSRLESLGFEVCSLIDLDNEITIVEDADTFAGNAIKKATTVCEATDCPALADDSGLEVDALGGRPGVRSARYGGEGLDDRARFELLLSEIRDVPINERSARFRASIAFIEPGGSPKVFDGTLEGNIAFEPSGSHGFGYDPVFIPKGFEQTLATLGPEIKNRISHRAKALDTFVKFLAQK